MRFDACDRYRIGYIFPVLSAKIGDFHRLKKFLTTILHTWLTLRKTIIVKLYCFISDMRIPSSIVAIRWRKPDYEHNPEIY